MAGENPILDKILELQARKQEMIQPVQVKNKTMTPGVIIQDNVAGDQVNGIPKISIDKLNTAAHSQALVDAFDARATRYNDPLAASRLHTFNASRVGYNYDRYYEHGKFKELGFSTRRNNEDIYTSKSSFGDDFGRMFGKLGSMIYSAGTEQFTNWGKFGTNGDLEAAALQEHNMSIAQSNREGFGAWTTNFISNSAYTLGVAAEMAVEELALLALTAATRGATAELAAVRTATNIGRLSKSVGQMVKLFNNADKAKSFWTATKGFGANVGRAIMPFDDLALLAKEAVNPNSKFNRLSNLAKTTRTFGAFYRGMKEINAVTSESRVESAFAQSDFLDKATEEFRKKEGRDPNQQEMQDIFERSKKAGTAAFASNVPLIYFSNKVVLDGALKGFRPLDDVIRRASTKGTFYSIGRNAKTGMAELVENGFKMPKFSLSGVKEIPSRFGKALSKQRGLQTLGSTVKYFRANLMEGLQESGQEVAAGTVNDYYLQEYYADLYKDPFIAEHNLVSSSFSKAIESQFSSEGLDIFLSGFLMGGPMQKINNLIFNKGSLAATKLSDWRNKTNKYEEYKNREKESFQAQVDAINYVEQNKTEVAKTLERNLVEQRNLSKDYQDSLVMNDRHGAENAKDEMLFKHITTLLRTNNYDSFMDVLKDLKKLDKKDLQDAFSDETVEGDLNNKDIYSRLDSVIGKAENIKKRYEAGMKEENPFHPSMIDPKKNPEAYAEEKLYHELFEQARIASIFSEYSFDRAGKRYQSLLNKFANIDYIKNLDPIYVQSLVDPELQIRNVQTIKSEIAALKMGDESDKAKAKEKEEYLNELVSTISEINQFRSSYAHIKRAERNPDEYGKLKERADTFMPYVEVVDENGQMQMFGELEPDVRLDMYHKEQLEKAMMKYFKLLAKMNNSQFRESDAEGTISELMDLVKLDTDAQYNLNDINKLRDPYALLRLTQRLKSAHDKIKGKEAELRAEAVLQFNQMAVQDDFLQWMADNGLFFDPDLLKDFLENNQLPKHFIDASTGNKVTPSDPRYQKIIDKLNEIEQLTGRTFSGKPVPVKPEAETQVKEAAPAATPEVITDYTIMTPFDNLPDEVKVLLQAEYDKTSKVLPIDEWKQNSPKAAAIIQNTKVKQPAAETLGFENLGDIGNQGLAIMEADILSKGKFIIDISKATPEQKQKIDSNVEELKKKYPEKNITSKVVGNNLVVETGVVTPAQTGIPLTITRQVRQQLLDLGYSNKDVDAMKPEEAQAIIKEAKTKPKAAEPAAPVSDKKADIEKTLYGTISGSIPLSQALPNGVYTDLGNGLFAYADKNEKIAAIVDRTNGYIVSKSFWNEKQNKWQLPNQANLKDDAKKLGVDEATYIKKYQDAVDSLNKAELAALGKTEQAPVTQSKEPVSTSTASEYPAELAPLFEKRLGVSPDNNSYVLLDENNNPIEGSPEWMRVTRFIDSGEEVSIAREYSDRGLVIDNLLRRFFTSKPLIGTDKSFQDIIKEQLKDKNYDREDIKVTIEEWVKTQIESDLSMLQRQGSKLKIAPDIYESVADALITLAEEFKDFDWYSDVPTLYGTINGQPVAGTIDLLFVKDGKYYIIDSKTSNVNRKEDYQEEESRYKEKDTLQQNVYAELLRQMTGGKVDADVYILPFQMPVISNMVSSFIPSLSRRNKKQVVTIKLDKLTSEELSERLGGVAPIPVERRAVPETFRGKIIYAVPGTVDPEVYNTYDVVNADDVLTQVLKDRGIDANNLNAGAIAYKSADREGIYNEFIERLQGMTKEGKTVISSNIVFLLRPSISNLIFSLPSVEKAVNKKTYEEAISTQGTLNNLLQDFAREGETKTKYGVPVMQMLGIEEEKNEILDDFLRSDSVAGLKTHIHSYFTATGNLKDMYHILDASGNKIVMTPEVFENQVVSILDNLEKQDKIDKSDKKEVMDLLNSYIKKPAAVTELTQEETKEANTVAENAVDFADNAEAVNKALESADKEDKGKVNDDFVNNLDC